jgi:membrane protein DedA with SNARE-associated domain
MTGPALPGLLAVIAPYLDRYGYGAVGGLLLLEDFGVPVPGEAVMIAASVYAGTGRLNIVMVAVVAFVAAVMGDSIGWLIGRHGGRRLLARFGRYVLLPPHRVAQAEKIFARHGGKIVPLARFVGVLRQANGLIAGMTGMRFPRFLTLNAIGAALWVGVWTTVGDLAGHHISTLYPPITRFGRYELIALALLVLALLGRMAVRRHRQAHRGPSGRADPADREQDHAAFHRDLYRRADGGATGTSHPAVAE